MKAPDKVKEAANYVAPLVEEFFTIIKPWTQVKNYGTKTYDTDNQAAQRMQHLEEEAAKYKQRLRSAGIDVTPQKTLPIATIDDGSHAATSSQQPPPTQQDPPAKRRRLHRGDNKRRCEQMIQEPFNVTKQSGLSPPTSMTSLKTWISKVKKTLPENKQAAMDNHMQLVQQILEENHFNKPALQEMATRWGLLISLVTSAASPKTLQQLVAAVTFLAV